jgi:sorting nexin-8
MWHELRVVLHNRENALLSTTVKAFAEQQQVFAAGVQANWAGLVEEIDGMPFE